MSDRLIGNQIDSSSAINVRNILNGFENQPLMDILIPEVMERLLVSESVMCLDRSTAGFNGIPRIDISPRESITRAIIVNDKDKFVYQQINDKDGKGLVMYENGMLLSNDEDTPFPVDYEDSIREVSMRNLLTTFCNSTIKRLDTLQPTPVLTQPAFRFTSMHSGKQRPLEHLAVVQVTPNYWI